MAKLKSRTLPPLAAMAASNLDRAASEIDATRAALESVPGADSIKAQDLLAQAGRAVSKARALAISALSSN